MGTKHTPGPWVVAPSSNPKNGSAWRDIHSTGTEYAPSYVGEALEQDTRLIAAAPDLLAALDNLQANPNDPRAHRQALDALKKGTDGERAPQHTGAGSGRRVVAAGV